MSMKLLVFDDRDFVHLPDQAPDWGPVADTRAVFSVRTGALTTLERLQREWPHGLAGLWVPNHLIARTRQACTVPVNEAPEPGQTLLCINGRWVFPGSQFEIGPGQALVEQSTGAVVAACLESEQAGFFLEDGALPADVEQIGYAGRLLARRPWELLGLLSQTMATDLPAMIEQSRSGEDACDGSIPDTVPGITALEPDNVWVHPSARIYPSVVLDAEGGPIYIDDRAIIRPGSILCGPAYIGPGSTVLDRSLIKANTSIGPVCKVTGEVGSTIFQGYANKAHDGHLGDSYIGAWANLGAGTTNSNLLNTYGEIMARLRPQAHRERTGMMYLGSIIGDHVKTAINTRLMTGTVIGTGSMIASTAAPPTSIGAFSWITDVGIHPYRFEKFIDVARVVLRRRNLDLTEADVELLRILHQRETAASS
ncbi:MAG: hypothetical protein D8M59_00275 [Planctomycetes bacterium]|nr:hypothetical protein [Planctomycetota bacterium]NOG54843.1 hypothetical protein [Planctomycetota bacterium]